MKTPRSPRPAQTSGTQVPSGGGIRNRLGNGLGGGLSAGSDVGAASRRMTRRTAVLALGSALVALGGCGLRLGKGSPASLPTASAAETTRDGLARQAALISSTAGVVAQAGGTDATTAALAEGVKQTADAQLETLGGVWEPWASQVPSSYPTVAPVPSASADATAQDLATSLGDGSTMARRAAIGAASEQDARLFTALTVAWSLQHDLFAQAGSADAPRAEVAQGSRISAGLLTSYDAARYAMEEIAARSDDPQRTQAADDAKAATSVVNAAVAAGSEDARLGAYAAPTESSDPEVSVEVSWARQVWSAIVSGEVQEAGSAKASTPAREAAVTGAVDAARRATAWGADFSSLPGYAA
ncbi:Tat pathway signal protein [Actinomyces viscosus]|uniref:Tat pathway signal protein n=1 Tax=Actinomyces viscosus TaxID=1656 RepID=UPI001E584A59|nr:Tat pathway signal protein [Actinomyces viscosus]